MSDSHVVKHIDKTRHVAAENVGRVHAYVVTYIASGFAFGTSVICYLIALYNDHLDRWLPMISDCGVYRPERFIFTIGLNIAALFLFLNAYLFYRFLGTCSLGGRRFIDTAIIVSAIFSSIGMMILATANDTEDPLVHDVYA